MNPIYILAAIVIFGILIAVHEVGHFLTAKLCGVRVNEFSIGMGPAVWKKEKGETLYSFRLLPLGGFCAMEGEDEDTGDERAFMRQGFWKKFLILVAGSFMNFITGLFIVAVLYSGANGFFLDQIVDFAPEFTLQGENGLMEGDIFYKVNGYRTYLRGDASMYLSYHQGDTVDLEVVRDGKRIVLDDFPMGREKYTAMDGSSYTGFGIYIGVLREDGTFLNKVKYTWYTVLNFVQQVRLSLSLIISGGVTMDEISGPVGIVSTIGEVGSQAATKKAAWSNIFFFAAFLAVNLAVMNMLPIPALDGGRVFLLTIDTVCLLLFKRKIPEKYQAAVNGVCFVALMSFMLLVTFNDVFKLFR